MIFRQTLDVTLQKRMLADKNENHPQFIKQSVFVFGAKNVRVRMEFCFQFSCYQRLIWCLK